MRSRRTINGGRIILLFFIPMTLGAGIGNREDVDPLSVWPECSCLRRARRNNCTSTGTDSEQGTAAPRDLHLDLCARGVKHK